ncbi:hypothetical protein CNYM01_14203 [Colletotrichum nymphaeae SA-01]|uniref:Uncharacterized protein n=1 Tax=Colletotrichum nymphaeae SA-01 TaxID=1460502 RepID=A0A135UD33_9PEZI|nr:hypothetical protein CNYM01_14203 [Colletotrichum nymphaeae SA-01]
MDHGKAKTSADQARTNRVNKAQPPRTPAARYNRKILHALELAIKKDPEADLAGLLTSNISSIADLADRNPKVENTNSQYRYPCETQCC